MSYTINPDPSEMSKARKVVDEALSAAENQLPMEQEAVVALGWTEKEFTIKEMNGASGYALYPNILDIDFNSNAENWKSSLEATTFHEYAHIWDYEQRGRKWDARWEYVLGEALTQKFAEQNAEYESPWRTKHGKEVISGYWPKIRDEELDKEYQADGGNDPLFINAGDAEYPNWLGYSLSYQLGNKLLQQGYELQEFPEIEKEELIKAGDELYLS